MLKSEQRRDAPTELQLAFWNAWNAEARENGVAQVSIDQAALVRKWLGAIGSSDLHILDAGCGAGWLVGKLIEFGRVTGVDLADEVVARAARRVPEARFMAGDIMSIDLGREAFDVVVSLEVLSHVADQPAFVRRLAGLLRPGGHLMLATQNRPQLERNDIPPPGAGQIRQWVDRHQLRSLLSESFEVQELVSITPQFNRGPLRYVNSSRVKGLFSSARLDVCNLLLKRAQERAFLGWTLMALARRHRT